MNPIPLNDRGQFRYTDLVGYIPEFLQEEPDVVEFLQVMSDYINDAYRNIEVVERFEFKLCVLEAGIPRAMTILSRLRDMFELSSNRSERVCYLSVPRANVKSNKVFGKNMGYSPYTIDIGLQEVAGTIRSISSIDRKVASMNDGDVVFVRYVSMDPVETRAYYYSREANALVLDPEWSSQDPFTGTANTENRMISFAVDDISSIAKRYGGESAGNSYYEILFTARISEVRSEPATEKVYFDVDEVDQVADEVYVDYYGMSYVPRGKYHASISFYGTAGWAWKDGYPTGLFYLKETSGAGLSAVNSDDSEKYESPADPAVDIGVDRYSLAETVEVDAAAGVCRFTTVSCFPQSDGGRFYLMDKTTGECLGEFAVEPAGYAEGKFVTTARPVWMADINGGTGELNDPGRLFLMTIPLYFNQGMQDTVTPSARIYWKTLSGDSTAMNWSIARMERIKQNGKYTASALGRPFTMDTGRIRNDGTYRTLYIPNDIYDSLRELPADTELSCGGAIWTGGQATVDRLVGGIYYDGEVGGLLTLNPDVSMRDFTGTADVQLYTGLNGSMFVDSEGTCSLKYSINFDASYITAGRTVVVYSNSDTRGVSGVTGFSAGKDGRATIYLSEVPEPGCYDIIIGDAEPESGKADGMYDVSNDQGGWMGATCKSYSGDVFTDGLFRVTDGKHTAYVEIGAGYGGKEVLPYEVSTRYLPGDTVYSPVDGRLYTCASQFTAGEYDTDPSVLPYFRTDSMTRFRSGYSGVRNRFMPFYGQVKSMEFGGKVDYSGDITVATRPLYITKVEENRLKYGWEHREFLNYGTMMNMTDRPRNGSLEVFSSANSAGTGFESANDLVTATLAKVAKWKIDYPVVKRGAETSYIVDIDNPVSIVAEWNAETWNVTVLSAGHGLVEGALIRVAGFDSVGGVDINGYRTAHVVDGDTISFDVPGNVWDMSSASVHIPVASGTIAYIGEYWYAPMSVTAEEISGNGLPRYRMVFDEVPYGVHSADTVDLVDLDNDVSGEGGSRYAVTVLDDGADDDRSLVVELHDAGGSLDTGHRFHVRRVPAEGDYVLVGDSAYLVGTAAWTELGMNDVAVPSTLYARQNIATVSVTNPVYALGDDIRVESIYPDGTDAAIVRLMDPLPHFTVENAAVIEGRTMVRLRHVTPGEYNGWHTVTDVYSQKSFRMTVRFAPGSAAVGTGVNGGEMLLNEGRWYAYGINSVEWDKVSNRITYSLDNRVIGGGQDSVVTEREHGLSVGDYVVTGNMSDITGLDSGNASSVLSRIRCCRVKTVTGKSSALLEPLDGSSIDWKGHEGDCIARGLVLSARMDDLGVLEGEYSVMLDSLGGKMYRFRKGDIVVAGAQQNPAELKAWRVTDTLWQPVRAKRSMKVSGLDIRRHYNAAYDDAELADGLDQDKYDTFSDVDVASDAGMKYVAGFRNVTRARFDVPALPDMDTTRNPDTEYSSGEDYSNVAPRHDMKPGFRGVPAMKYPLAEKIERLCYLRDASVLDFDLIEYLARYLGYDITALGEDVNESSIYRSKAEREKAIRQTIADLPQYYTLGGTKPGLHMLMAAFGVVGEALTLWTDAEHPYRDMIYRDDVVERVEGGDSGKWVPTPYIDIRITNNADFPQFAARQSDIERIREQVRVYKPINVVFRDIMLQLVDSVKLRVDAYLAGSGVAGNSGAVSTADDGLVVEYSDTSLNNCAF